MNKEIILNGSSEASSGGWRTTPRPLKGTNGSLASPHYSTLTGRQGWKEEEEREGGEEKECRKKKVRRSQTPCQRKSGKEEGTDTGPRHLRTVRTGRSPERTGEMVETEGKEPKPSKWKIRKEKRRKEKEEKKIEIKYHQ